MRAGRVAVSLLLLGVVACQKEGLDPQDLALLEEVEQVEQVEPAGTAAPFDGVARLPVVHAVSLSENAVAVGIGVSAEGRVVSAKPTYGIHETIHASVPVSGHSVGKVVTIYWFGPSGSSVKTDTREIKAGETFVAFTLGENDGMKPGMHSAQVDIDDVPVGMADFRIQ